VAIDRAAAIKLGVGLGDPVIVNERRRVVSGLTDGTNLVVTQFIFGNLVESSDLSGYDGYASFFIVQVAPGVNPATLAPVLRERLPDLDVFDKKTFIENNGREAASGYLPMLVLVYILGIAAGAVLVGLLVHDLMAERREELAVMLALGVRTGWLCAALGWQGVRLALAGSLIGSGLTVGLASLLDRIYPVIPVRFGLEDVARILALFGGAGLLAALIPIMRLSRIDPLEAFRP